MNHHHVAEIDGLLEELNTADPATVWDAVIYPRLSPTERDELTTDMIRRGTFIHHHIPYGRSYYAGTWTTLLIAADLGSSHLNLVDRTAPSPPPVDTAQQTLRTGAVHRAPGCPQGPGLSTGPRAVHRPRSRPAERGPSCTH